MTQDELYEEITRVAGMLVRGVAAAPFWASLGVEAEDVAQRAFLLALERPHYARADGIKWLVKSAMRAEAHAMGARQQPRGTGNRHRLAHPERPVGYLADRWETHPERVLEWYSQRTRGAHHRAAGHADAVVELLGLARGEVAGPRPDPRKKHGRRPVARWLAAR